MIDEEERQEKRGFKVEDRRRFSETGEARSAEPEPAAAPPPPPSAQPSAVPPPREQREAPPPLPITFSTFVLSLSTQALAHLGEIPNPIENRMVVDLPAAKQLIDILGILQEKSKGNLDNSESGLLDSVLYDLRLKYVERVRRRS